MSYHSRRELRTIEGMYGEALTIDYLNVVSVRINSRGKEDGEWMVVFRIYTDLEMIEVPNKARAKEVQQRFIDFCTSENEKEKGES